ncbi:thioredoxin domain-containing protein [Streptomyces verrucosisporus]|uniref:thioredoxin domain-containing protein n=1 Tax=Streptomyces verrucosisporus TaxID=1695161 RepID=UPI0019D0D22F|nr:thioredoxin domain-containing protein [Streptomyces verrucosisporus]MBN3930422.1 thioredoxin domain-containing protein [Streptomyces verrucosisporus]
MNRLAGVTSPYLLQHADNPVDWWPWGPEAFEEAKRRDVPVLLSVGYSACHWCHVMAHESFEDGATAEYLNAHYVSVKVDREERPDVDAVYMEAVQAATGQGGWPMTVFLTPDGEPFYFGTYFPPEPRHGMPSFRQVLEGVRAAWTDRREEVAEVAGRIVADLAGRSIGYGGGDAPRPPRPEEVGSALLALTREFDARHGGFGGAPKFPPSMVLEFLLRHHARTGSEGALQMVEATCEAMARGGLYDQLGGGFARYSVDAAWTVPHFEKMLYDNALLCRVYAHLWRATGSERARRVALETADFMVRELRTPQGAFASALDADSDDGTGRHREGAYYVWTPAELREVLGEEDAELAAAHFGVTEEGTFEEGASVLRLPDTDGPADAGRIESVRRRLLDARSARPRPGRDDKAVAAWNGLAIAALAETGAYFDRPDLVEAATAAADLLVAVHLDAGGRLARTSRDGAAGSGAGVLEDYGDVAEGFLALYSVTGESCWLGLAGTLLETVLTRFTAADGTLYDTADDAERLIRRPQDPTDNAAPSGWTAAAAALLSYAAHTGSSRHREAAERALGVVTALAPRVPRFIGWGLAAAEAALDGPREIAVVGPAGDPATAVLHRTALLATAPGAVVAVGEPSADGGRGAGGGAGSGAGGGADEETPALLRGRPLLDGRPAAYVCRHFACDAPTADPERLARTVGAPAGA